MSIEDHEPEGAAAKIDVASEERRQDALLKTGALQNAILNSANFSSIATDDKGVIQIFNIGAQRMLGYTTIDVLNKITPADISDSTELIARAHALSREFGTLIKPGFEALVFKASRGIEDIYELTYIRKDSSRFPAVVSVTALRDARSVIIGYLLIGTDNSARKRVEAEQLLLDQRLRDQQFYTRSLIESNIDALMTTDPSGVISDVNKQMEVLTGYSRDELIGTPFGSYFTDAQRAEEGIRVVLEAKKLTNYELTASARNGKLTVVSCNATTFYDRDGKLQGVFAAARDITERKQVENELQLAITSAEKANRAKSEFLSSMSHELRTPLGAILGFAQLIESGVPAPTALQKRSIGQILKGGWYLLDLINEILDLALVESGRLSLSLEPISLADVMLECQAMIESQAEQRSITVAYPRFDTPLYVMADHTRIKQILINLLSNALKYNKPNGFVTISCHAVGLERLRISVEDTGEGLSAEQISHLFQPFNRLGQEQKTEEGTGIGLVMTKSLIDLMKGAIGVESTPGQGSIFWIELNLASTPQLDPVLAMPPKPETRLAAAGMRTMLYIEDNPANLMLVEDLVQRRPDIRLISARDGPAGIKMALEEQPDMILLDINLPGINGLRVLEILSHDLSTASIPVVALSANAMPHDIEKGLQAGFLRYLTKPINIVEFMDTLDFVLKVAELNKLAGQTGKDPD